MSMLIVDDTASQRMLLTSILKAAGYTNVIVADSAATAFAILGINVGQKAATDIDLVLMDISMPQMDGIEACRIIKATPMFQDLPIIMVTASTESADLQLAFDAGATDFINKPPNRIELLARVRAALRLKEEMDRRKARERELLQATQQLTEVNQSLGRAMTVLDEKHQLLQEEQERSEQLLLNILPQPIADQLKRHKGVIAKSFEEVTVLFADIVDFTRLSARISPNELVILLNEVFSLFDRLAEKHKLEKIKTIGDAYMVVGGLPTPRHDHAQAVADMALDMRYELSQSHSNLAIRIGIDTGPVVAGVIGTKKFSYDLWGNTVNTASRMESHGFSGSIQVTEKVYARLCDQYSFDERGEVYIKSRGTMQTYLLVNRKGVEEQEREVAAAR